jgi:hypothetical protein
MHAMKIRSVDRRALAMLLDVDASIHMLPLRRTMALCRIDGDRILLRHPDGEFYECLEGVTKRSLGPPARPAGAVSMSYSRYGLLPSRPVQLGPD